MERVCFLTSTLNYGGATKILIEIANYLINYYEVSIMYYGTNSASFYSIDKRIKIIYVPVTNCNIKKIRVLSQMYLVSKALRNFNPDLVIAFGNTEKLFAVVSAINRNTKVIISERQDPYNYRPGKKRTMWIRYLLADGCVFQTEGAMRYFPQSVQQKSVVIPNFIIQDERDFVPIERKNKTISFSARFELKQKRQDIMVKAFRIVNKLYPDWKLIFYGDGADEEYIHKLVNNYNLSNVVFFAGKTANVLDKIYSSAIFVICSDYEGIPNALMEAMGLGVASITTDCSPGGAKLLIQNEKNGLIVPAGDENVLAKAIIRFIENPILANNCALEARRILQIYSPKTILPLWKNYIMNIISGTIS